MHLAETIVPFALGMPLISARRSQLLENLPIYVNKLGITHLGIVPSLIEATLNAAQSEDGDDIALRYIASGGEKMSDSVRRLSLFTLIMFIIKYLTFCRFSTNGQIILKFGLLTFMGQVK